MATSNPFRCVFSISSGRAGSAYLARLLGTGRAVHSYHEAPPQMTGDFLDRVNGRPMAESRDARRVKSAAIREIMDGRTGTYAETNHMFIKTFYDVIAEDFGDLEVVVLRRELARVVKSFVELYYFTAKNPAWVKWLSLPGGANSAIAPIAPFDDMDQYDRIIAYLVDIEARGRRFAAEYPGVRLHDVRLESLSDPDAVRQMFDGLCIEPTPATNTVAALRINERRQNKARFANPADLGYCRERLAVYLEKSRALGIPVPATLALNPL